MRFTKPSRAIGVDIGSHSIKAVMMSKSGHKMRIDDVGYALVDRNQVNVDPVAAHANALREAIRNMQLNHALLVGALPGQTVVIRYPRLRDAEMNNIDMAIEKEAGQNIPYDLSEVFLDWSLLEEEGEGDDKQLKVLLVAAKHEVIDSRVQIADAAEVDYNVLSVDSLALADAAEGCDFLRVGETVALINIGASSASIHFTRDGVSNFIRDVSWGARELIQAIAKAKRCDYDEAEKQLYNIEADLARHEKSAQEAAAAAETARNAAPEPLGGGGSLLDPFDDELGDLGSPSSDLGELGSTDDMAPEPVINLGEVLAQPIARLVSEIRRSFDYYEHQLYEKPVERIIISGGIAHLSPICAALAEDLGVEEVLVADPAKGAIALGKNIPPEFRDNPAQFMVAVGLAARGAAEL